MVGKEQTVGKWCTTNPTTYPIGESPMAQFFKYSSIVQQVERLTVNQEVVGSSPAGGAK